MTIEAGQIYTGEGGRKRPVLRIEGSEVVFLWPLSRTEGRLSMAEFEAWIALAPEE